VNYKKKYKELKKRYNALYREKPIVLAWGKFELPRSGLAEGTWSPVAGLRAVKIHYWGEDYVLVSSTTNKSEPTPPDSLCSRSTE